MNNDDDDHGARLVRQVWNNHLRYYEEQDVYGIDTSLPAAIARSLHPMPDEMAIALDWWRNKMIAAIDVIVQSYKDDPMQR
jgi:hypothetical protein